MTDGTLTAVKFLEFVKNHKINVLRDDGIYRHVAFMWPELDVYGFSITTIPGHLVYTGDMGTYVFRWIRDDMFDFFRKEHDGDEQIPICPEYWSDRISAEPQGHSTLEFSNDKFRQAVRHRCAEFMRGNLSALRCAPEEAAGIVDNRLDLIRNVKEHLLDEDFFTEHEARAAVETYHHRKTGFAIPDFYNHIITDFSYHFIWCCYAISWGIQTYDQHKAEIAKGAA